MSPRVREELLADRVVREMRERAAAGEPEPGVYICGRCGRDDCRMYTRVVTGHEIWDTMTELNKLDSFGPGWEIDLRGTLLCPCCSFPHLSGCQHQPLDPRCPVCDLSTLPTGSLPTGGPFVRCDGEVAHPAGERERREQRLADLVAETVRR